MLSVRNDGERMRDGYIYARLHRANGEVDQATLLQADMRELKEMIRKAMKRAEFEEAWEKQQRESA